MIQQKKGERKNYLKSFYFPKDGQGNAEKQ